MAAITPPTLLTLPPELRELIWHFVFATPFARPFALQEIQHDLTRVSRGLRAETLPLFLHLTRFNAHLDDKPTTPLANWLVALGAEKCLLLREVNIWDLHMLNGTLHGVDATNAMLKQGPGIDEGDDVDRETPAAERGRYVLHPVGRDIFHGSWYLQEIVLALQTIGLGLRRFCEVRPDEVQVKQMSHFAIVRAAQGVEGDRLGLIEQLGLTETERQDLMRQLDHGKRLIQLSEGRRKIYLAFDEERGLVGMRQQFIPRDEEFYM